MKWLIWRTPWWVHHAILWLTGWRLKAYIVGDELIALRWVRRWPR